MTGLGDWIRTRMNAVEGCGGPPWAWAAALGAVVVLRNLVELLTARNPIYPAAEFFLHYPLAYLGPFLALSLVLSLGSGERIGRVSRLMVLAWALTLLPPLIRVPGGSQAENAIFYGIPISRLGYPMPMEGPDYLERLLFFFSPFHRFPGTTVGIRVETLLACVLALAYVRLKGKGWPRAGATAAGVYLTALCFFHLPMLFYSLGSWVFPRAGFTEFYWGEGLLPRGAIGMRQNQLCVLYLTGICGLLGAAWSFRLDPAAAGEALRRRLRFPLSALPFAAMTGLLAGQYLLNPGAVLRSPVPFDVFALFSLLFAVACAAALVPPLTPSHANPVDTGWALALAAAGLLFAFVAGAPACVPLVAALVGVRLLFDLAPFRLATYAPLGAFGWTLGTLIASLAGFALFLGAEAIPLLPSELIRIPVLAYLPAFLAAEMMGTGDRLRVPAAVLAAAAPVSMAAVLGLGGIWLGGAAGAGALLGVATRLPGSLPRTILRTAVPLLTVVLMLAAGGDFLPGWKDRAYGSVRYHARRAQGLEAAGQYGAALEARRRAVELSPQAPSARYDLGVILVRLGENRAAADAFAESVRLDPTFAEARENLGEVLLALGETEEARAAFGEAAREWERRLETGELSAFGRRQARERIDRLRDLAGAGSRPAPDQFR